MELELGTVIGTILRHDHKTTSYKLALVRALNDLALGFPALGERGRPVAVPVRLLAERWVAYYWPFTVPDDPIPQGRMAAGKRDLSFRADLTALQQEWARLVGTSRPADGFYLVSELQVPRRQALYPPPLLAAYEAAVRRISRAIQQPLRYAGPGEWAVFSPPRRLRHLAGTVPLPGTHPEDRCVVVEAALWRTFRDLSLWVEALCIHEWCLYTEQVAGYARGAVYSLLTERPGNRRPLTWERNQVELLMLEGQAFTCPWTGTILTPDAYDLDHIVPVAVYPLNELWNLVPADRQFNQRVKRDRLPGPARLVTAAPRLATTYAHYGQSADLAAALAHDATGRFTIPAGGHHFPDAVAAAVATYVTTLGDARNLARF